MFPTQKRSAEDEFRSELESTLNRMSIFFGDDLIREAQALEPVARAPKLCRWMNKPLLSRLTDLLTVDMPDAALTPICLVVANSCTTDDLTNTRALIEGDIGGRCRKLLESKGKSSAVMFAVLDVVATLCTNCSEARDAFRLCIPPILDAVQHHKTDNEVLFATVCALSTLSLSDPQASVTISRHGGLQTLVDISRYGARSKKKAVASADQARQSILSDIMRWARQALMNAVRCASSDIDEALQQVKWGQFGDVVEVDELKFAVTAERRRIMQRRS